MAGAAPEGSQFDARQYDAKMSELLGSDGQDFFTSYDEVHDSFDVMGLQENLLRGIYAYGVKLSDASKKLGKKFATGASVVKGPTEKDRIDVQGDIFYDIVEFITATWPDLTVDVGLIRDSNPSFTPSELQNQDPPELQGFTAYDPQTGYNVPYYRPSTDRSVRGQDLPSQEVFSSHNANSIPSSTVSMVQQQPHHLAQMYPQVHVSHYANMMSLRQFIPPVYAPPMAVPIYSNNSGYPHMSNGNNFLLIPGGASHLNPNNLKYGVQQFKPIPAGSPIGFGNYTNPAGYAMNAPSLAGGATGLDDSSRMKYKDGNLYVPNQQVPNQRLCL